MRPSSNDGLPPVNQPFDLDSLDRWPMSVEKRELWGGVLVFYGKFDERDLTIARRAFTGRAVSLDDAGSMLVGPPPTSDDVQVVDELLRRSMGYATLAQVAELRREMRAADSTGDGGEA
ncbi:hypothetical protein ABTZ46_17930 [Nocardioides sp. NPDC126508]